MNRGSFLRGRGRGMGGSKNFVRGGPTLLTFFFISLMRGGRIQILLLAGQGKPILMAFHWRAVDGPTLNAGLVAF